MNKTKKNKKQNLNEALSSEDYQKLRDIIRAEIAAVMFDLFKKRNMWI